MIDVLNLSKEGICYYLAKLHSVTFLSDFNEDKGTLFWKDSKAIQVAWLLLKTNGVVNAFW